MRRARTLIPVGGVTALVVLAAVVGFGDPSPAPAPSQVSVLVPAAVPTPSVRIVGDWPDPLPRNPTSYLVADALGDTVDLFAEPGVAHERPMLDNPTHEGLPLLFLVEEEDGDWLKVRVSMRPNGAMGWVKRDQVRLRSVPNRIEVELSSREVRVFHGDDLLWEETSVIGSDRTPTPVGTFFVDGWVPLSGGGAYGAGQLSVAGFSEVLHSFGGGIGQIAIHGTNRPELIGSAVSNGCIRLPDDKLLELVELAPLGTPVIIRD